MSFEPWMLAAIDQAGYNGIRTEHINAVAEEILSTGVTEVSQQDFDTACCRCGITSENFTQADLDKLQERLLERLQEVF